MPNADTSDDELVSSGVAALATNTTDNEFDAIVFTPSADPTHPLKPGKVLIPNVDRFLNQLMRLLDKAFAKAKLKTSFSITLPSAPGGKAVHQVYSGFDEFHQISAAFELTWVIVGTKLCVFWCSYSLPQEQGVAENAQHCFSTITFKSSQP